MFVDEIECPPHLDDTNPTLEAPQLRGSTTITLPSNPQLPSPNQACKHCGRMVPIHARIVNILVSFKLCIVELSMHETCIITLERER